ncbi:hypothetical protein QYM36_003379, partial [Artemia franciscana]
APLWQCKVCFDRSHGIQSWNQRSAKQGYSSNGRPFTDEGLLPLQQSEYQSSSSNMTIIKDNSLISFPSQEVGLRKPAEKVPVYENNHETDLKNKFIASSPFSSPSPEGYYAQPLLPERSQKASQVLAELRRGKLQEETQAITYTRPGDKTPCTEFHPISEVPESTLENRTLGDSIMEEEEAQFPNDESKDEFKKLPTGEVYTIQEVEEEETSPTAGDGVTSLRKKAEQQRLLSGTNRSNLHYEEQYGDQQQLQKFENQQQTNLQPNFQQLQQQNTQQQQQKQDFQNQQHNMHQIDQGVQNQTKQSSSPIPSIRSRFSSLSSLTQPFFTKSLSQSDKNTCVSLNQLTQNQGGQPHTLQQGQSSHNIMENQDVMFNNFGSQHQDQQSFQNKPNLSHQVHHHHVQNTNVPINSYNNQYQNQAYHKTTSLGSHQAEQQHDNQAQSAFNNHQMNSQYPSNQSNQTSYLQEKNINNQVYISRDSTSHAMSNDNPLSFANQHQGHQTQALTSDAQLSEQNQMGLMPLQPNQGNNGFSNNAQTLQHNIHPSQTYGNQIFHQTSQSGVSASQNQWLLQKNLQSGPSMHQTNQQNFAPSQMSQSNQNQKLNLIRASGDINSQTIMNTQPRPIVSSQISSGLTSVTLSPSGVPPPAGVLGLGVLRHSGSSSSAQQLQHQEQNQQSSYPMPQNHQGQNTAQTSKSGTISGMLADFTRALGLGNTPRVSPSEEKQFFGQNTPQEVSNTNIDTAVSSSQQIPLSFGQQNVLQHATNSPFTVVQPQLQSSLSQVVSNAASLLTNSLQQLQSQQIYNPQQNQQVLQLQLEQQQILLQQQLEYLLAVGQHQQMLYSEQMQLQHQAQHLKKLKRTLPHATHEQQQLMLQQQQQIQQQLQSIQQKIPGSHIVVPKAIHPGELAASKPVSSTGYNNTPAAALLHQATVVGDPWKRSYSGQYYGDAMSSANALQRKIRTLADGRSVSPNVSPEVEMTFRAGLQGRNVTDSPDTLSETDSQASLRLRRKLPILPAGQDAAPLPTSRRQNRTPTAQDKTRNFSTVRQGSFDGLVFERTSGESSYPGLVRPTSETNLKRLAAETVQRPGSALGLLHGANLVSSSGFQGDNKENFLCSTKDSFKESIAAILPPDLRHLVDPTTSVANHVNSGAASEADNIMSEVRRRTLEEELRKVEGDRLKMADRERLRRELERLKGDQTLKRYDISRTDLTRRSGGSSGAAIASSLVRTKRARGHRRIMSDPRFATSQDDIYDPISTNAMSRVSALRRSFEFESLDDSSRFREELGIRPGAHSVAAINSSDIGYEYGHRGSDIGGLGRRSSESGVFDYFGETRSRSSLDSLGRQRDSRGISKPRSWHPSPYGSDEDMGEDDDIFSRDRKQRIKAEIVRRRMQMDQSFKLHDELYKVAKMRDGNYLTSPRYELTGVSPPKYSSSSMNLFGSSPSRYDIGVSRGHSSSRFEEERSMERLAS